MHSSIDPKRLPLMKRWTRYVPLGKRKKRQLTSRQKTPTLTISWGLPIRTTAPWKVPTGNELVLMILGDLNRQREVVWRTTKLALACHQSATIMLIMDSASGKRVGVQWRVPALRMRGSRRTIAGAQDLLQTNTP